jgi:ATP-binding cassette subfamily B protein
MDCGPACLQMIAKFYGKNYSLHYLRENAYLTKAGVSLLGISDAAEKIGFHTMGASLTFKQLQKDVLLPCIVHWNQKHFIVVYKIKGQDVFIADPMHGLITINQAEFEKGWLSKENNQGVALLMEPTSQFHELEEMEMKKPSLFYIVKYLKPYKGLLFQLFLGMLVASVFDLILPFLTQSMVDYGVNFQNISFVNIILASQLMIFLSRTLVELLRSRILLHIGSRINITIISEYLYKMMQLPLRFFDSKMLGDITQRINDQRRIESFLTTNTLTTAFSFLNLIVFAVVLGFYSLSILGIFLIGSFLSIAWVFLFQKKRKEYDYIAFNRMAENQSAIYELVNGMSEIKIANAERIKRWEWERIQIKLFKLKNKLLTLSRSQQIGSSFFNQLKNIIITYIAAKEVINGNPQITLGVMMAISYIIGQMNAPIDRFIDFIRAAQDARISLDRLSEVQTMENEDQETIQVVHELPADKSIHLKNVSFQYAGPNSTSVLNQVSLHIPAGKVTAIVGSSGSGKTTLIKLLLKFYEPSAGEISIAAVPLKTINASVLRSKCGVVMQDGFIFTDTISRNIVGADEHINVNRLIEAARLANIDQFIQQLPLGYTTKIGMGGDGLSVGQKQRILIARAIYKQPEFIFLDEATSALDAKNEKIILENLTSIFKDKTVVVVAHRLSTVKNADQIIVMEDGCIVETGTHESLSAAKGKYFDLVKNQLELGA